jgi:hypothetical protein
LSSPEDQRDEKVNHQQQDLVLRNTADGSEARSLNENGGGGNSSNISNDVHENKIDANNINANANGNTNDASGEKASSSSSNVSMGKTAAKANDEDAPSSNAELQEHTAKYLLAAYKKTHIPRIFLNAIRKADYKDRALKKSGICKETQSKLLPQSEGYQDLLTVLKADWDKYGMNKKTWDKFSAKGIHMWVPLSDEGVRKLLQKVDGCIVKVGETDEEGGEDVNNP